MPFDEDYDEIKKSSNIKQGLTNDKSMFNKPQINSESKINEIEKRKQSYSKEITDAVLKYKNILNDKTLKENKNKLHDAIDSDVIKELTDLASKMNSDKNEQEGIGSVLLCTVLLKFMLMYRDRANELEFKLEKLSKKIDDFPNKIEERLDRWEKAVGNQIKKE